MTKIPIQNYTASILVEQSTKVVFHAIMNFRGWWSEQITGKSNKLNDVFIYNYKDIHLCKLKLIEVIAEERLVYQVLNNRFNFTKDKSEWINTKLIFDISTEHSKTRVIFTHEGLVPEYECFEICCDSWSNYIYKSLYNLITAGKGEPNKMDNDGFDTEVVKKWKLNL